MLWASCGGGKPILSIDIRCALFHIIYREGKGDLEIPTSQSNTFREQKSQDSNSGMSNLKAQQQLISQISLSASTKIWLPQWDLPFPLSRAFGCCWFSCSLMMNLPQAIMRHALIQFHFTWFLDILPSPDVRPSLSGTTTAYSKNIWFASLSVDVFSRSTKAIHHKMSAPAEIPMLGFNPNLWNKFFFFKKEILGIHQMWGQYLREVP